MTIKMWRYFTLLHVRDVHKGYTKNKLNSLEAEKKTVPIKSYTGQMNIYKFISAVHVFGYNC